MKILEISSSGDGVCVESYGRELLPLNALDGNVIKDIEAVSNCIKKLIVNARLTCKKVALAVPDSAVISKVVQINDGLNNEEMEELIAIEADKYIPYPIDEINLDFEILGHSAKNSAMLDVLIVASRAENVNSRVEAVNRAGLTATIVDVESYAVERAAQQLAMPAGGQDKIVAIIDIGARFSHLFVLHGMKLVFSREEKFGSIQLVDAIAEHYQMTQQQVIEAQAQRTLPDDYDSEVLEPFKETLLLQVKRTLQFFYSTSQDGFVDHILLAGGLARQPDLATLIQEQLGVSTTVANPLSHMSFSEKIDIAAVTQDAPSLMVACGLALRNME
nr:type IV pilus assembly protein PilM [Legionella antarctica]